MLLLICVTRRTTHPSSTNRSLVDHIHDPATPANVSSGTFCRNCRQNTHTTDNCGWLGQPKCNKCGWFGHIGSKCFHRERTGQQKRKSENEEGGKSKKSSKKEQSHRVSEVEHDDVSHIGIIFTAEESAGICNFGTYDPHNVEGMDERLIYYDDWLADTATTSHISNSRNSFVNFESLAKPISGVGNAITYAQGKGTVDISLGRWDNAGGKYRGNDGLLTLITKDGQTVATGVLSIRKRRRKSRKTQKTRKWTKEIRKVRFPSYLSYQNLYIRTSGRNHVKWF